MRILTDAERVARAYATLDLPPDVSADAAQRQYRRLVKRWHPDRYASDPQGQADAAQRMRQINAAFAVIRPLLRRPVDPPSAAGPGSAPPFERAHRDPPPFGSRLSPGEVDAIVASMRGPSMFDVLFHFATRAGLCLGAVIVLLPPPRNRPHSPLNVVVGVLLIVAAVVHARGGNVRVRWPRRRWWYNR